MSDLPIFERWRRIPPKRRQAWLERCALRGQLGSSEFSVDFTIGDRLDEEIRPPREPQQSDPPTGDNHNS